MTATPSRAAMLISATRIPSASPSACASSSSRSGIPTRLFRIAPQAQGGGVQTLKIRNDGSRRLLPKFPRPGRFARARRSCQQHAIAPMLAALATRDCE